MTAIELPLATLVASEQQEEEKREIRREEAGKQLRENGFTSSTACLLLEHFPVRAFTFSSSTLDPTSTSSFAAGQDLPTPNKLCKPTRRKKEERNEGRKQQQNLKKENFSECQIEPERQKPSSISSA